MAAGQSDAASAIRALSDEFTRCTNAGDADGMVQGFYTEDACLLPPHHPMIRGRAQIRDFFQGMIGAGVGDLALETVTIDTSGDLAYRVGRFTLGKPVADRGQFLEVYRRQPDGSWRCVADMFGSEQAPGG